MTLNGVIANHRVISPNSVDFWADYVKVVEDTPILSAGKCRPKNLVFNDISIYGDGIGRHGYENNYI